MNRGYKNKMATTSVCMRGTKRPVMLRRSSPGFLWGGVKASLGCVHRAQHAHCHVVWRFLLGRPYSEPQELNGNRNLTFLTRFPSVTAPLGRTSWCLTSQGGISVWAHTPRSSGSFTKVVSKHKTEEMLQQTAVPRRCALLSHTQRLKAGFSERAPGCPGTSLSLAFI